MGVFLIVIGVAVFLAGIYGKEFFTADPVAFSQFDRKISSKTARALFVIVALCFIASGIALLAGAIVSNSD